MHRRSGLLIAGLLVSACSHGHGPADTTTELVPEPIPVHVNVTNNYSIPVEIYAVAGGTSYRMGIVHPGLGTEFVLRQAIMNNGPVEFLAQPTNGDPPYRSGRLLLAPGEVVDLHIEQHLLNSSAVIRR